VVPDIPGKQHLLTLTRCFSCRELPQHAVVWGGGYIAVEFAGILAGLALKPHGACTAAISFSRFDDRYSHILQPRDGEEGRRLQF